MPRNVEIIQKQFGSENPLPSIELAYNALKLGGVAALDYATKEDLAEIDASHILEELRTHEADNERHFTEDDRTKLEAAITEEEDPTVPAAVKAITEDEISAWNDPAIVNLETTLTLENGTDIDLTPGKHYKITGLKVNNVTDSYFVNSIIYVYKNSSNKSAIALVYGANMAGISPAGRIILARTYMYDNDQWSLRLNKRLQYSTTDLTDGVSDLDEGAFYFVYE